MRPSAVNDLLRSSNEDHEDEKTVVNWDGTGNELEVNTGKKRN